MLCADDFGLSPGISRGIARLAAAGRLNAVSCLTNGPHWRASAPLLRGLPPAVDVGLHWNLTDGEPLSAEMRRHAARLPSLPALIAAAHLRRLPAAALAAELAAQWATFTDALGREPAFVDGHQHVHHLPQARDALLAALAARGRPPAVRSTARLAGPGFALKRMLIERTGGRRLGHALHRLGLRHNAVLLGAYDFADADYRARMQAWLRALPLRGGLLFCHPGDADDSGVADPIAAARQREAAYLGGADWPNDRAAAGVVLGRAWPLPASPAPAKRATGRKRPRRMASHPLSGRSRRG